MTLQRVSYVFENTSSFTTGSGTVSLYVECFAGGGGGGGSSARGVAAGGGGGAYSAIMIQTASAVYTCSVGGGGLGGLGSTVAADNNTGSSGGDTFFDSESFCLAIGGVGGQGSTSPKGGAGGLDDSGVGELKISGASGSVGFQFQDRQSHDQYQSGDGAVGFLGGVALGVNSEIVNHPTMRSGSGHGAGGSGANSGRGGPGSPGFIRIWEYS